MLFGGSGPEGMDRRFIRRFIELGGGPREARVAVVPTASEERADTIAHYEESFRREDVQHLEILDVRERSDADLPETLQRLSDATAVMFTGGVQLRARRPHGHRVRRRVAPPQRDGVVIGGSSAGSIALGDPVILRGEPTAFYEPGAIRHAPGLALVEGATVDTHLVVRGRPGAWWHGRRLPGHDRPRY